MEQPLTPPDNEGCEVCGRQCSANVCRACRIDAAKTERDE